MTPISKDNHPETIGDSGDHDAATGRFVVGNKASVGHRNPNARQAAALRSAILLATTPESIATTMTKLFALAQSGNVDAARLVLDRAIGKPRQESPDPPGAEFELPPVRTSADCFEATQAILAAVSSGALSPESAAKVAAVVETTRRTIETVQLERRLDDLELSLGQRLTT